MKSLFIHKFLDEQSNFKTLNHVFCFVNLTLPCHKITSFFTQNKKKLDNNNLLADLKKRKRDLNRQDFASIAERYCEILVNLIIRDRSSGTVTT